MCRPTVVDSIRTHFSHVHILVKSRYCAILGLCDVAVTHLCAHTLNVHTSKVPVIYYTGMLSSLYTAQIHDISVLRTSRVYLYSVCLSHIYRECLAILLALLLYLYVSSRPVSWLCCVSD